MLVFAAIVPHPPLLIPNIGKNNLKKLKKTVEAFDVLEKDLNESNPDTIIVISPHGEINMDSFCINTNQKYNAHFQEFGDFATKMQYDSDLNFVMKLKSRNEATGLIQLISDENLDHGAAVPLYYLTRKNPNVRIVPISYSYLSYNRHVQFGEMIKEAIYSTERRYAVIASGDLSHRLSLQAPAGFSPKAKEFDKKLIQILKKKSVDGLLNIDAGLIEEAGECGLRSILILSGIIKNMNYEFEVLNYEAPFGVGYLVGEVKFN